MIKILALIIVPILADSQNIFWGTIEIKSIESYSEKGLEAFLFMRRKSQDAISLNEYLNNLKTIKQLIICNDTLIYLTFNSIGDTISKNVQIKSELYSSSKMKDKFFKIKIKTAINEIKDFKETNQFLTLLESKTKLYKGATRNKSTEIDLYINQLLIFESQAKFGYLFSDVFSLNGFVLKTEMRYIPWNDNKVSVVESITYKKCDCKSKLNELNFFPNDSEVFTLDKLLVKSGKDTMLIEEKERQLLSFKGKEILSKNVDIENIKGSYTLIDLWATWSQPCLYAMPFLGDIYEKYRYADLKVVSISLDGESALEKWKKTIDKQNMYWDNYIMTEGFDSELCKQLNVKTIPHYILLDPEGRIMLENAPGPSDPILTEILDRLLKSKK